MFPPRIPPLSPIRHSTARQTFALLFTGVSFAIIANLVQADDASQQAFFEKHIRPALIEHCIDCHGPKKQRGGLRLDSRSGWVEGGDSGPAITPGDPGDSLLMTAVRYDDVSIEMPPRGKLPQKTIDAFQQWISRGAIDPRIDETPGTGVGLVSPTVEQGREFWAFRPLATGPIPIDPRDTWSLNHIDRFIADARQSDGIQPVGDADRQTFIRRVTYDLTGLPPTPRQIQAFVEDQSPRAYENLVDRLLQSPNFGVRWGRHWLDVVRFAESSGGGRTLLFPDAWRYRDYVIDSFNADVPFDQFVQEQIAGDLMPSTSWLDRRRKLIATAFLLLGPTNYELQDKDVLEMDVIDEQLDTLGKSLLGMTIGCARCHDHKFDPIPARDYYAMAGILKSTKAMIHSNVSTWNKVPLPVDPELEAELAAAEARIKALEGKIAEAKKAKQDDRIKTLKTELTQLKAESPKRPVAMAVDEEEEPSDIPLAIRGVVGNPGDIIPRGAMQVLSDAPIEIPAGESGRLQFAHWIASDNNPLIARVMANRVWYWMMGRGLVATVDNFGSTGATPTHPELLDHLGQTFIASRWSVKTTGAVDRTFKKPIE